MKTITIEIPDGKKAEWINGVLTLVDDKPQEPNELIKSFEDAVRYLKISDLDTLEEYDIAEDSPTAILLSNDELTKKIDAYAKLTTIAIAWNKIDGFVADWKDTSQYKYFPWFEYSRDNAGFVYALTSDTSAFAAAYFGSRLCFKTRERAIQFGKQFIELWNDLLR